MSEFNWVYSLDEPLKSSRVRDFIINLSPADWFNFVRETIKKGSGKLISEGLRLRTKNGKKNAPDYARSRKQVTQERQISFPYID